MARLVGICVALVFTAFASCSVTGLQDCDFELGGPALPRCILSPEAADGPDRDPQELFLLQRRAQRAQPAAQPSAAASSNRHELDPREVLREFTSIASQVRKDAIKFSQAMPSRLAHAVKALGGSGHQHAASVPRRAAKAKEEDDAEERACIWSAPAAASEADAGPVRSYEGVLSAEGCLRWCLGESTCLAAVFESSSGACHGVPWRSDDAFELVVPDSSAVVARKKNSQECVFSRPRSGKSPGSVLQHRTVSSLADCQQLCMEEQDCLSTVFRATKKSCYLLPRAFDEKAEFSIDDAMMSNKLCRTHSSFEDPALLSSQRSGITVHLAQVSTLAVCEEACEGDASCHAVLFHEKLALCHLLPSNSSGARHFVGTHGSVIAHADCGRNDSASEVADVAASHDDDDEGDSGGDGGTGSDGGSSHDNLLASSSDALSDSEVFSDESVAAVDDAAVDDAASDEEDEKEAPPPAKKHPSRHSEGDASKRAGSSTLSQPRTLLEGQSFSGKGEEAQTKLIVSVQSGFSIAFSASWYSLGFWARVVDLTDGRVGDGSGDVLRVTNVADSNGLFFSVRAGGHESHVQVKDAIDVGVTSRFLFSVSPAGTLRVFRDGKKLGEAKGRPMQKLAHGQLFLARPTVRQKRAKLHMFEGWLSGLCAWSREASWEEATACESKDAGKGSDLEAG